MKTLPKALLFLSFVLIASIFTFGQIKKSKSSVRDPTQGRSLTHYVQGHYTCRAYRAPRNCEKEKFDELIWKFWTEKIKGYATITYYGIDASTTRHVFVEPNKKNQWQLIQRNISRSAISPNIHIENKPTAFSVERIESKSNEWTLLFKDKLGRVIE